LITKLFYSKIINFLQSLLLSGKVVFYDNEKSKTALAEAFILDTLQNDGTIELIFKPFIGRLNGISTYYEILDVKNDLAFTDNFETPFEIEEGVKGRVSNLSISFENN
jgi:hypothetical protein